MVESRNRATPQVRAPYQPQRGTDMDFRMRYYNTLVSKMGAPTSINTIPEHLVPGELYHVHVDKGDEEAPGDGKQSSVRTIFSIWNTMMGSTLMALPWGYAQAGLVGGVVMTLVVGFIAWYTCWLILKLTHNHNDLFELAEEYLGTSGRFVSWLCAILFGIGILISYDILMTVSLLDTVEGFRLFANHGAHVPVPYWNRYIAAGVVSLLVLPLALLKRHSLLVKINTFSIILLIYIIVFFLGSSIKEGVGDVPTSGIFKLRFGWLSGVLTASFVLHNALINITRSQRNPENNLRDLSLGFVAVIVSYLLVGSICYIAYQHSDIVRRHGFSEDFLSNFPLTNIGAIIARICLVFYLLSAFPIMCTILRIQFFGMLWQSQFPSWSLVIGLNVILVAIGTVFAMFLPHVSSVLRYVGSTSGVVLVFILPPLMYWLKLYREGYRKVPIGQSMINGLFGILGLSLFISQFF